MKIPGVSVGSISGTKPIIGNVIALYASSINSGPFVLLFGGTSLGINGFAFIGHDYYFVEISTRSNFVKYGEQGCRTGVDVFQSGECGDSCVVLLSFTVLTLG